MRCAGMTAMIKVAATPAFTLREISYARRPVKIDAYVPNQGGIMQQMSFRPRQTMRSFTRPWDQGSSG